MVFHDAPSVDIYDASFPITTSYVVNFFHFMFKEIGGVIGRACGVEQSQAVNESKPITIVEKNISLLDPPVEHMVKFHQQSI